MSKCQLCGGSGVIPVSGAEPPYRPCPDCTLANVASRKQNEELRRKRKQHDTWWAKGMSTFFLILGAVASFYRIHEPEPFKYWYLIVICWFVAIPIIGVIHYRKYKETI